MVCLGNICRSPLAHGIMEHKVFQSGLNWQIDSAGISDWHKGESPDHRAIAVARQNGIQIDHQSSRMIEPEDFRNFDYLLIADDSVMQQIRKACPPDLQHKLHYMIPHPENTPVSVPDPYYGSMKEFESVYQLLDEAMEQWLIKLR